MEFTFAKKRKLFAVSTSIELVIVTALFALFFVINSASAQLLSVKNNLRKQISFNESAKTDWTVYCDHDNRMIYIDFEKINTNLSTVTVKDNEGRTLFKDENLWQLPVNTIYEIDCDRYNKGDYTLELKSFTASIKKGFTVK